MPQIGCVDDDAVGSVPFSYEIPCTSIIASLCASPSNVIYVSLGSGRRLIARSPLSLPTKASIRALVPLLCICRAMSCTLNFPSVSPTSASVASGFVIVV